MTKKIVRRTRKGVAVVPVIFYAPEPLHAAIKAIVKRQGTTQDALLNRWASVNVANAKRGQELRRKQLAANAVV